MAAIHFGSMVLPDAIKPKPREITNHNVNLFHVGHLEQFDAYVHCELKKLSIDQLRSCAGYMPSRS